VEESASLTTTTSVVLSSGLPSLPPQAANIAADNNAALMERREKE